MNQSWIVSLSLLVRLVLSFLMKVLTYLSFSQFLLTEYRSIRGYPPYLNSEIWRTRTCKLPSYKFFIKYFVHSNLFNLWKMSTDLTNWRINFVQRELFSGWPKKYFCISLQNFSIVVFRKSEYRDLFVKFFSSLMIFHSVQTTTCKMPQIRSLVREVC